MLYKITLLTTYLFCIFYPLCLWAHARDPIKHFFHRFHLGLPCVLAGITVYFVYTISFSIGIKQLSAIWLGSLLMAGFLAWRKEKLNIVLLCLITISSILGFFGFLLVLKSFGPLNNAAIISWALGGIIFCVAFYAMNLGHFYLNVHGLPIQHLMNTALCLCAALILRTVWDLYLIIKGKTLYMGDEIPVYKFMLTMDGFLLWAAVFFGALFPLISVFFVFETLKLKNTQSSTGILYVMLSGILLGDIAYKYYLIKFGIPL